MTIEEIDELIDDTRKMPRATDKVSLSMAVGVLEVARQLAILNAALGGGDKKPKAKAKRK